MKAGCNRVRRRRLDSRMNEVSTARFAEVSADNSLLNT